MEHSPQIIQHIGQSSLNTSSPNLNLQGHQHDLPVGNICQLSSPFQSNLRLASEQILTEEFIDNQDLGLSSVGLADQMAPISLQVNSQKPQEFFIDLESILKERFKVKQKISLKKRVCSKNHSCSICHQKVRRKSTIYRLKCKHVFHHECLDNWKIKRNNCPLCRKHLI